MIEELKQVKVLIKKDAARWAKKKQTQGGDVAVPEGDEYDLLILCCEHMKSDVKERIEDLE